MNAGHEQHPPQPGPHPGSQPPAQSPRHPPPGMGAPPGMQPHMAPPAQPGQVPAGQVPGGQIPGGQAPAGHAAPYRADAYPADQAFAPGGGLPWSSISKRFTWHRRLVATLTAIPVGLVGALVVFRGGGTVGMVLWGSAVLLAVVLAWIVAELAYRSYGYAERGDDLIVTQGVFVKRLIVVPYGRMQFVDVTAGLLERWMGISTVRMHTAAAATDAEIPGLPTSEAALLRDRLAQKGEERSMGL